MNDATKARITEYVLISVATVGIFAIVVFVLFTSYRYFEGYAILYALAAQLGLLVILFHLFRWWRYPGLFQSKSPGRLIRDVLFSILLIWMLPVFALLARLHLANLLPLEKIGTTLGLEFRFHKRKVVQVSRLAPNEFHPGGSGRVASIRVVSLADILGHPLPVGTVLYRLVFGDGEIIEVQEEYLTDQR
jgi:hypothetical protein